MLCVCVSTVMVKVVRVGAVHESDRGGVQDTIAHVPLAGVCVFE